MKLKQFSQKKKMENETQNKEKTNRTERRRMATNKLTKPHTEIKQKQDGRTDGQMGESQKPYHVSSKWQQ